MKKNGEMAANLHLSITSMLEEAKWMRRLEYKMPDSLHNLNMANVKDTLARINVC